MIDHTLAGHIVIGIVQVLTVLIQAIYHVENKKNVKENKETLQKIEVVLRMNGYSKKEH